MYIYTYLILLLTSISWAHPVSYESSKGIMGEHSSKMSHIQLSYSHKYWYATGYHHYQRSDLEENTSANFLTANFLLKRWNTDFLQANLYSILGLGQSELSGTSRSAQLAALQFDIEDRDYYFLAKQSGLMNTDHYEMRKTTLRAGFTPYVGAFDDIHTWFILEWAKTDFYSEQNMEELIPYLRFFYKNILFEIGHSFDGTTNFNYITHF